MVQRLANERQMPVTEHSLGVTYKERGKHLVVKPIGQGVLYLSSTKLGVIIGIWESYV